MKDFGFSKVEQFFRYALTGAFIYAFLILRSAEFEKASKNMPAAYRIILILMFGMFIYAVYRLILWVAMEPVLTCRGCTAMAKQYPRQENQCCRWYCARLARFIALRRDDSNDKLGGYLDLRWGITHFLIVTIASYYFIWILTEKPGGVDAYAAIERYVFSCCSGIIALVVLVFAIVHLFMMYLVESNIRTFTHKRGWSNKIE